MLGQSLTRVGAHTGASEGIAELEASRGKKGFLGGSVIKNPAANAADTGSVPGLGRFPGRGNGNPLQYSCLENSMDRQKSPWTVWQATVHGVTKSWTQLRCTQRERKTPKGNSLESPGQLPSHLRVSFQC